MAEFYFDQLQAVVLLEDQPENGQGVLRGGELGVGAQVVCGFPEVVFEFFEVHGFGFWVFFGVDRSSQLF